MEAIKEDNGCVGVDGGDVSGGGWVGPESVGVLINLHVLDPTVANKILER
jgi:hypothetical protein